MWTFTPYLEQYLQSSWATRRASTSVDTIFGQRCGFNALSWQSLQMTPLFLQYSDKDHCFSRASCDSRRAASAQHIAGHLHAGSTSSGVLVKRGHSLLFLLICLAMSSLHASHAQASQMCVGQLCGMIPAASKQPGICIKQEADACTVNSSGLHLETCTHRLQARTKSSQERVSS